MCKGTHMSAISKIQFFFYFFSCGPKVEHYRVRYTDDNKLTVDDDTYFENLTKLVQVCDVVEHIQALTPMTSD